MKGAKAAASSIKASSHPPGRLLVSLLTFSGLLVVWMVMINLLESRSTSSSGSSSSSSTRSAPRHSSLCATQRWFGGPPTPLGVLQCDSYSDNMDAAAACADQQLIVLRSVLAGAAATAANQRTQAAKSTQSSPAALFQHRAWRWNNTSLSAGSPARHPHCSKWLVQILGSEGGSSSGAAEDWAGMQGWCRLLVSQHGPRGWLPPGDASSLLVSPEQLLAGDFATASALRARGGGSSRAEPAVRLLAYLAVIQRGAQVILEVSGHIRRRQDVNASWVRPPVVSDALLVKRGTGPANPYAHFWSCRHWPRGFPYTTVADRGPQHCHTIAYSRLHDVAYAPIQHGLPDGGLADVDAACLFLHNQQAELRAHEGRPLAIPPGAFAPVSWHNTAFHRDAFWALFLPAELPARVADVWRSYWAQRLLWQTGAGVLFVANTTRQQSRLQRQAWWQRAACSEQQMYAQAGPLLEFLSAWRCRHSTMFDCMLELGTALARADFWSHQDSQLLAAWIADLASLGYQPPPLLPAAAAAASDEASAAAAGSSGWAGPGGLPVPQPVLASDTPWPLTGQQLQRLHLKQRSKLQCARWSSPDMPAAPYDKDGGFGTSLYLSVVFVTRNVVEVPQQLLRLSMFLKSFGDNIARLPQLQQMIEILIVDYNSDPLQPPVHLQQGLVLPDLAHRPLIRVIRVPPAMHAVITREMSAPVAGHFWEFAAKNIAMRRACGEFILATNSDAYFAPGFFDVLAQRPFSRKLYYRMGRVHPNKRLPAEAATNWTATQTVDFLLNHTAFTCCVPPVSKPPVAFYGPGNAALSRKWLAARAQAPFAVVHADRGKSPILDAPGDFTLMHRDHWQAMRGYPELPLPNGLDDVAPAAAAALGLQGATLAAPAAMFHQHHDGYNYNPAWQLTWRHLSHGSAYSNAVLQPVWDLLMQRRVFVPYNAEAWGFSQLAVPEEFV